MFCTENLGFNNESIKYWLFNFNYTKTTFYVAVTESIFKLNIVSANISCYQKIY